MKAHQHKPLPITDSGPVPISRSHENAEPSERRLQLILNAVAEGFWDWDLRTGKVYYSPGWLVSLGYSQDDLSGDVSFWESIIHPDDLPDFKRQLEIDLVGTRTGFDFECRLRTKSGRFRWFRNRGSVVEWNQAGQPTRMAGTVVDVHERRFAREELAKSQAQLFALFETTDDLIWSVDAENFGLVTYNSAFRDFLTKTRNITVLREMSPEQVFPADRADTWKNFYRRTLEQGDFQVDYEIVTKTNILHLAFHQLLRDGEVFGISVFARDITDRKRAEEALRDSEERLRLAVQAGRMYAFEWDCKTGLVSLPGEEPQSRQQHLDRVHAEDRARLLQTVEALTAEHAFYKIRYRIARPDGDVSWIEESGRAFFDEAAVMVRLIGIAADVTEARNSERALRDLSGRLITSQEEERRRVGRELHDSIGQELALLAAHAHRIGSGISDSEGTTRADVHELHRKIKELAPKVSDLSHRLHSSELEYLGLGAACERFCRDFAQHRSMQLEYVVKGVPRHLDQDVALCFYRMMQESLQNVLKHSKAKTAVLELLGNSEGLSLSVSDDGVGFDPKRFREGGLGLVSMRERIRLIGGTLSVISQPGKGTKILARVAIRPGENQS